MKRLAAIGLAVGIGISACTTAADPSGASRAPDSSRCEAVPAHTVLAIEEGLTVNGGGSLRAARMVRSADFERVWFVAADLQGPGLNGPADIGVWATNNQGATGSSYFAVDGVAKEFSDWGDAGGRFSLAADGVRESRDCARQSLG